MDDKCCSEVMKRLDKLDDILAAIRELKSENGRLRADLDSMKGANSALVKEQENLRKTLVDDPNAARRSEKAMRDAIDKMSKLLAGGAKPEQLAAGMTDVIGGLKKELAENPGMPPPYKQAIEESIATGKLMPGQHLDESDLAAQYGVSRTPVREALRNGCCDADL